MKSVSMVVAFAVAILVGGGAQAKTIRAIDMDSGMWAQVTAGLAEDIVVEFRQGDLLPITISSAGDFFDINQSGRVDLTIKRSFWIKLANKEIFMSLDGATFKPFKDLASGSFSVGAGAGQNGGPVNALNMVLEMYLK